jgi:hypothetical protein
MNCGFPGLQLPAAPLLACDTAKVLAALTGLEPLSRKPLGTSVKSKDPGSLRLLAPKVCTSASFVR